MSRPSAPSGSVTGVLLGALVAWSGALPAMAATEPSPGPTTSARALPPGELTVFAAASLADVLGALEDAWWEQVPEVPLVATFGASNVLAAQIVEGAQADVFLSADLQRPTELADAGLTAGPPLVFARNRLVIVTPLEADVVQDAADLAAPGARLVAALPGVPITRYADEAVAELAATTADPVAFVAAVEANVVSREDNVRAALAKVELGEGDAAIVYVTDARSSELVREVPFPDDVDVSADYAGVQVSEDPAAAFLAWLRGPEALAVLTEAGFEPPE